MGGFAPTGTSGPIVFPINEKPVPAGVGRGTGCWLFLGGLGGFLVGQTLFVELEDLLCGQG